MAGNIKVLLLAILVLLLLALTSHLNAQTLMLNSIDESAAGGLAAELLQSSYAAVSWSGAVNIWPAC